MSIIWNTLKFIVLLWQNQEYFKCFKYVCKAKANINLSTFTSFSRHGWLLLRIQPGWSPWGTNKTQRCPQSHHQEAPAQIHCMFTQAETQSAHTSGYQADRLTLAMSHTVTSSQVAARSKLCTLFFTLRASLQSPHPKSATTRVGDLQQITTKICFQHELSLLKQEEPPLQGQQIHMMDEWMNGCTDGTSALQGFLLCLQTADEGSFITAEKWKRKFDYTHKEQYYLMQRSLPIIHLLLFICIHFFSKYTHLIWTAKTSKCF